MNDRHHFSFPNTFEPVKNAMFKNHLFVTVYTFILCKTHQMKAVSLHLITLSPQCFPLFNFNLIWR